MAFVAAARAVAVLLVAAAVGAGAFVHKTIESGDGDVIDCVDMYHQPALKHAAPGRRETIQLAKPEKSMGEIVAASALASRVRGRQQTWRKHGSCPAGTVPIRRASRNANPEVAERVRRASPFGRPRPPAGTTGSSSVDLDDAAAGMNTPTGKVEVAAAYGTNAPYLGARAEIPYWSVDVHPDEFSMSYLLVGYTLDARYRPWPSGKPPADLTNQIAVGLVAWPSLYGDSLSRLFVYYTTDGGSQRNCFDLDCGGFHVQENNKIALGAAWSSDLDSQVGGVRHSVTVSIHRDAEGMNWWVSVMDEPVGYFPESVFNTRFPDASYVEMGGRVLDTRPGGNHTTTPMGSGMPACGRSRFAATIMEYLGISSAGALFSDPAVRTVVTTPSCYGAISLGSATDRFGYDLAYGGPGGVFCDLPE